MLHAISVIEIQLSLRLQLVPEDFQIIPTLQKKSQHHSTDQYYDVGTSTPPKCGLNHMSHMGSTSNVLDILWMCNRWIRLQRRLSLIDFYLGFAIE
ncbi:hypothetical protein NQ315_003447 [Exocentrus adspersus]|uniref:Uncharacterized protein n=1 Tax=Exocentrus adspersus TaxID=1586481 RepID=A0AAV8VMW9_9CUCU|nr:hypothetical protein NQ315_003447 [Exocentrus adspersus]